MSGRAGSHGAADGRCVGCEEREGGLSAARRETSSRLAITLGLAASYLVAELVGGWLTNSLALLADAGHMFSDVAALAISLAALRAAALPPTSTRTWGLQRAEALAALTNAVALCLAAGLIAWEAVGRLSSPPVVEGGMAFVVATGGLLVNVAGLAVLGSHHDHGIGVRSAWLHLLGDALGSLGAMTSAALIATMDWRWADPVASLLIAALIVRSALALLSETVDVLLEAAPRHLDVTAIRAGLLDVPGVRGVHDLHVWTITSGLESLSAHVVVGPGVRGAVVLRDARAMLAERFGLDHVTLQVEEFGGEADRVDAE